MSKVWNSEYKNTQEIIGNQYLRFGFINNILSGNISKF